MRSPDEFEAVHLTGQLTGYDASDADEPAATASALS